MEGRQRRRLTWPPAIALVLVVGNSIAGWWLHLHNHLDIWSALVVACMAVGTFVPPATWVICRQVTSNREAIREATRALAAVRIPVTVGQRICTTTRYIPHRDLEPNRTAVMRDLLADHTGDISDYR